MPGQTKTEIAALLAAAGIKPCHRYGQNFLIDLNLMRKLVDAAEPRPTDVILEVGPGTGSLTECLLESGARVAAVEIDRGLCAILRQRLGPSPRLTILNADALADKHHLAPELLQTLAQSPPPANGAYKLVANLPYQIATPLIMDLLLGKPAFERLVFTIQREVGQRLIAAPRSEAYGPVSIVCQSLARIEQLATLPPTAFWPRPKVKSVMLALHPLHEEQIEVADTAEFARFVQGIFTHRRKMLRRILKDRPITNLETLCGEAGFHPDARPEELSPSQWRLFHRALRARRSLP